MKKSVHLNSQEWCDIIFKDKNKLYGAYEMRMSSSKRHIIAMGFTLLFAFAAAGVPLLIESATAGNKYGDGVDMDYTMINLIEQEESKTEVIDLEIPEPPSLKEQVQNTIAYLAPTIGDDIDVPDDAAPPTMEDILADRRTVGYVDVEDGVDNLDAEILRIEKEIVDDIPQGPIPIAEVMPQFPGGEEEMMRYIGENLRYPAIDQEIGNQGRVIIRFVVDRTGNIDNVQVVRGISTTADKEAMRVVKSMPKWIPGRQNGNTVAVYFTLPILFRLK